MPTIIARFALRSLDHVHVGTPWGWNASSPRYSRKSPSSVIALYLEVSGQDARLRSGAVSVAGALAAVDMEDLAGHEARRLEVKDRFDDVGDLAHVPDRVKDWA
jgi:hypothetical protein